MTISKFTIVVPRNKQIIIQLPADFSAKQVVVSILPIDEPDIEQCRQQALTRILAWDTATFSTRALASYARIINYIQHDYHPNMPPPPNLWDGIVTISDDFDDPLPKEIEDTFDGSLTDEYGLSLESEVS